MGLWAFYFFAKFYLYLRGYLRLDFVRNLAFLAFILWPVPERFKSRPMVAARSVIGTLLAFLLLWRDSWLPPLGYSINFATHSFAPSREYVVRFLMGLIHPGELMALALILSFCIWAEKRVRLTPAVIILLALLSLSQFGKSFDEVGKYLDSFYQAEAGRLVRFEKPSGGAIDPPFDIVFLHICSLSSDDLHRTGLESHPFFKQFNYVLSNFNTATGHSGPSAIRLLRANCGQERQEDLYRQQPAKCYVMENLRNLGYKTYFANDNDGTYMNFAGFVESMGKADAPIDVSGLPVRRMNFDETPIYDDYAVLEKWWKMRQSSGAKRAAVYFDAITLHDGSHWVGDKKWWSKDRPQRYGEAAENLFENLNRFFKLVASSGRNVVIVFVPEHGAALGGSKLQAAGLRELPLPPITTVPVGFKLIGEGLPSILRVQTIVSKPTSYLAMAYVLAQLLKQPQFGFTSSESQALIANIPETQYVAENEGARIVKIGAFYHLYAKQKTWIKLPSAVLGDAQLQGV